MVLGYCDVEWFALEMNRDHFLVFEIASKCWTPGGQRRFTCSTRTSSETTRWPGMSSDYGAAEGHVPASKGLTKCGPLEEEMASHLSMLALRTP